MLSAPVEALHSYVNECAVNHNGLPVPFPGHKDNFSLCSRGSAKGWCWHLRCCILYGGNANCISAHASARSASSTDMTTELGILQQNNPQNTPHGLLCDENIYCVLCGFINTAIFYSCICVDSYTIVWFLRAPRWYIGPTAMPRAAVTPIAPERSEGAIGCDSRPRHCRRDDIPAWRPNKITLLSLLPLDLTMYHRFISFLRAVQSREGR